MQGKPAGGFGKPRPFRLDKLSFRGNRFFWGCSHYPQRALVCRLFCFAGNRDRLGVPRLAMCRIMKAELGDGLAATLNDISAVMPLFADAGMRITSLHPVLGTRRLPINRAINEALVKVGMYLELSAPPAVEVQRDPEDPSDNPVSPRLPPRRRAA